VNKYFKISTILLVTLIVLMFLGSFGSAAEQKEFTLVIRMMDSQDKWFKENIVPQFEEKYNVKLKVISFDTMWDIEKMLKMEKDSGKFTIGLVKTPLEMTRVLTAPGKDFLQPYDDIMKVDELINLKKSTIILL